MKKIILAAFLVFSFVGMNLAAMAHEYLTYTASSESFNNKKLAKNYQKRIVQVKNISSTPLKLLSVDTANSISINDAYLNSQYKSTAGSIFTNILIGSTIIGIPYGMKKASAMVENKNKILLDEINNYGISAQHQQYEMLQPNQVMEFHLIEKIKSNSAVAKVNFSGDGGKFHTSIECK